MCCAIQSVQIAVEWLRQSFSKGTGSPVRSCDSACVLQVIVGRSDWYCYMMYAIWMLGFARNIVFLSSKRRFRCRKSWLAHAAVYRHRRFSVESCSNYACSGTEGSKAMCSTVVCCNCVVRFSLCRSQWNGCVKVPRCCGCLRNTIVFGSWES